MVLRTTTTLLALCGLAACGEGLSSGASQTAALTVDPAGGDLRLGDLLLRIPARAVGAPTRVRLRLLTEGSPGVLGPVYEVDLGGASYMQAPEVELRPVLDEGTLVSQLRIGVRQTGPEPRDWMPLFNPAQLIDPADDALSAQLTSPPEPLLELGALRRCGGASGLSCAKPFSCRGGVCQP